MKENLLSSHHLKPFGILTPSFGQNISLGNCSSRHLSEVTNAEPRLGRTTPVCTRSTVLPTGHAGHQMLGETAVRYLLPIKEPASS